MNERLATLFHGAALAFLVGWVLAIGEAVFAPVAIGFVVLFVIVGLARLLGRVPVIGPRLPLAFRLGRMRPVGLICGVASSAP